MATLDPTASGALRPKLFIDSGAYSAETQGVKISPYQYTAFLRRWKQYVDVAANLDVLFDAEGTWKNQELMESLGERPMPTFHFGEDEKWLVKYIAKGHDYIAMGGQVGQHPDAQMQWLDRMWDQYLTNDDGYPIIKVHAFGVTSPAIMERYPWFSVDSTSWLLAAATGKAVICDVTQGAPRLMTMPISDKSPDANAGQHWDALTLAQRDAWAGLFAERGFEPGALQADYLQRFFLNARAYVEFAAHTPSYKAFQVPLMGLFPTEKAFPKKPATEQWGRLTMYLAGNPGAARVTKTLMQKGYNRLLSYHYIAESMSHFNEAREVLDTWHKHTQSSEAI